MRLRSMIAVIAMIAVTMGHAAADADPRQAGGGGVGDIRAGILLLTNESTRHIGGQQPFVYGADYTLPSDPHTARPGIYFDGLSGSRNGGHVRSTGFGLIRGRRRIRS